MQDVDDGNTRGDLRELDKAANLWTRFGECGTLMLAFTFLSREDGWSMTKHGFVKSVPVHFCGYLA
jgi:hypothetical protein